MLHLRSITGKLVFWLFICTSIVLVSAGIFLYERVENIMISSVDRTLHSKLQIITGLLHEENGRIEFELSDIIAGEYVIPRSGHYYKVMEGRNPLAASLSLPGTDFDFIPPASGVTVNRLGEKTYTSTGPDGEPVRVLRYEYAAFDRNFAITLAESLLDTNRNIARFGHFLLVAVPLTLLLLCLIAWWTTRKSLRPLKDFSMSMETITHKNLTERIETERVASELIALAASFNALLDRLNHLFESQRRLVADASHQLKTPLSVISTQCDVALQRERSPEDYSEALRTILAYSRNMARLINNLLSLARLDAGLISAEGLTRVSLRDCVDSAIAMVAQLADELGIRIAASVDDTLYVTGSETGLVEAFHNLIENGIRYNHKGGMVTINAEKNDGKAVITVSDTGRGISGGDMGRIFERFYRSGDVQGSEGTGLGLSIVKSVINAHGGDVRADSEPGKGSCFTVTLPLADSL